MVASGQRVGFIDEGLQTFCKEVGLRGGPWHNLRCIIAPRNPRRHVLPDRHRYRERAVRGRVDDRRTALADDFPNLELVEAGARRQRAGRGADGTLRRLLADGSRCRLWRLHANRLGTRLGFSVGRLGSVTAFGEASLKRRTPPYSPPSISASSVKLSTSR